MFELATFIADVQIVDQPCLHRSLAEKRGEM